MTATFDHRLFEVLVAPPDPDGARLLFAVALARWAFLCGPIVMAALWLFGGADDRDAAVSAGLATALALVTALVLSTLIVEPRPFMDGTAVNYLDHGRDDGFPSDHAALTFAVALATWSRMPPRLPDLWIPLLAVAIAVGWARIYLGAHYPVDVAGGALVAAVAVAATASPPGRAVSDRVASFAARLRPAFTRSRRNDRVP